MSTEEEEVIYEGRVDKMEDNEERTLSEQLEQQQAQLDIINDQLAVDPTNEDLKQLQGSLEELVDLLKEELLRMKKAKLLSSLEAQFESENPQTKENSLNSSEKEESTSLGAVIEQFNGQECSVPFGTSAAEYHDAILKADENSAQNQTLENLLFNAFFLYPLTQSMLTCPFYLKGSCRFTSATCKFSHGHPVSVEQIRPKIVYSIGEEVNYQKKEDRKLFGLVRNSALPGSSNSDYNKHDLHLWTRCEIVKTDPGTGRVLVKLVRDSTDYWVPMEMLVLVDQEFENEEEVDVRIEMSSQVESSSIINPSSSFGEWERYTRGIGSKLLLKMGYKSGTGLGTRSQGILNPIESYVFPAGKSLDTCFTLKAESEQKKLDIKEVLKEKAKKLKLEAKRARQYEKAVEKGREKSQNDTVFRFLDDMFYSGASTSSSSNSSKRPKITSESSSSKISSKNATKNLDAKSLALSAFKVDEELKKAEAELRRYEESFKRNSKAGKSNAESRDLSLKTIMQKRDRAKEVVDGLRKRQLELGRETTLRKDKQKMIF